MIHIQTIPIITSHHPTVAKPYMKSNDSSQEQHNIIIYIKDLPTKGVINKSSYESIQVIHPNTSDKKASGKDNYFQGIKENKMNIIPN